MLNEHAAPGIMALRTMPYSRLRLLFQRTACRRAALALSLALCWPGPAALAAEALNPRLLELPPNRWIKLSENDASWHRQQHAGLAYDSKRGHLLVFGSNTHGHNWDNSVHEFDPVTGRWTTNAPPAAPDTYTADARGRAVAGPHADQPWAMHTYDNIEYDRYLDALVVTSVPAHNYPPKRAVPQAREHPTWIYEIATRRWRILDNEPGAGSDLQAGDKPGKRSISGAARLRSNSLEASAQGGELHNQGTPSPVFFGGASAYDSRRDALMAYQNGMWELGGAHDSWRRIDPARHHRIHYTMVYDSKRGQLAVFGNRGGDNTVWLFTPPAHDGTPGHWEHRTPGGDACPPDQHFPAAFDARLGVYLLVVDDTRTEEDSTAGRRRRVAESAGTFVYDPDANRYQRLPDAEMPAQGMNYMMAYDPRHDVFLLVTGDYRTPVTVWALKLQYRPQPPGAG